MRVIDSLEEWGWIEKEEPLWWDLDYKINKNKTFLYINFKISFK